MALIREECRLVCQQEGKEKDCLRVAETVLSGLWSLVRLLEETQRR